MNVLSIIVGSIMVVLCGVALAHGGNPAGANFTLSTFAMAGVMITYSGLTRITKVNRK